MFSFFSWKKHKRLDDKVYMKRARADQALLADAARWKAEGRQIIVICFFEQSLDRIESELARHDLKALQAGAIASDMNVRNARLAEHAPTFLFVEHHPDLKTESDAIVELENIFTEGRPTVGFYAAMDEPLLKLFGTEKIAGLMQKMGMDNDGAAFADAMINRAIRNAQSKVSARIAGSMPCRSQEEWIRINLPGGL
ncbi:MAG: hypothetical protein ABI612_18370 [Betaproteobacteria bacterium]